MPPALYKAAIRDVVRVQDYELVVYLDADIVVRGPLARFLRRASTREFVCANDMGNTAAEGYCGTVLTPEERSRASTMPGANGGFFCARGDRSCAARRRRRARRDVVSAMASQELRVGRTPSRENRTAGSLEHDHETVSPGENDRGVGALCLMTAWNPSPDLVSKPYN
jgi:hypothetical protein